MIFLLCRPKSYMSVSHPFPGGRIQGRITRVALYWWVYVTRLNKGQTYAAVEAIWPNRPGPWEAWGAGWWGAWVAGAA